MASKIGLILSLLFVSMFFLLGVDLLCLQFTLSSLDAKSLNISYIISQKGTLDDALETYIEEKYDVEFECLNNCNPMYGDIVDYTISCEYSPIIISKQTMEIKVKRYAVIGYYG